MERPHPSPAGWLRRWPWSGTPEAWRDRLVVLVALAGAALLVWLSAALAPAYQVLLWGLLLLLGAVVVRRGWLRLFGPVLFYDLVRIARHRRYFLLRTLYVGLLLFLLLWIYTLETSRHGRGGIPSRAVAGLAETFFNTFMIVQFLVLALLTPAYTAGAIAEEKDRKTLEFLLATDLHNREIVLGKLIARLANLALLLLAGLPILSLLQVLGGVDPNLVLAGFAATLLTMASLGGLGILNSVLTKRPRDAIATTYLGAIGYLIVSGLSWLLLLPWLGLATFPSTAAWTSPVTVRDLVELLNAGNIVAAVVRMEMAVSTRIPLETVLPTLLRDYALFHGLVAVGCTTWAVLRMRALALQQSEGKPRQLAELAAGWRRRRVGDDPMLWKELHVETGARLNWPGRIVVVVLVLVSLVPAGFIVAGFFERAQQSFPGGRALDEAWRMLGQNMNIYVRVTGTMIACLMLLSVAVRASGSVSTERDRQTLDALLTTPLEGREILGAKWIGSVLSVRWTWVWLGLVWLGGVVTGGLHVLGLVLLLVAWFVYAGALACLGLWFSVVCRTTLRATLATLLATLAVTVGHWLLWMCCIPLFRVGGGPGAGLEVLAKLQIGVTPPLALGWLFSFPGNNLMQRPGREDDWLLFGLLGLPCWVLFGGFLWVVALTRFGQLTGREVPDPLAPGPRRAPGA